MIVTGLLRKVVEENLTHIGSFLSVCAAGVNGGSSSQNQSAAELYCYRFPPFTALQDPLSVRLTVGSRSQGMRGCRCTPGSVRGNQMLPKFLLSSPTYAFRRWEHISEYPDVKAVLTQVMGWKARCV
ncbi:hypothetical protein AVEN_218364-1 [Araneus ventricosus]|uniref:Uncharacterized protein n=1 Tax=Araneus ventricosus TaxID=182803 RepID=A0A4Y2RZU4_ARAVE|nr:hypothetical protein AVEN_218364-1 [Araneus ventricosus]